MASASDRVDASVAYPLMRQSRGITSTRVIFWAAFVFTLLAILRGCLTSSSDSRFKVFVGLASAGCFLGILSASNIGNRIFRTAVLREAVRRDGYLENGIITVYRRCNSFADFSPRRAEATYEALQLINIRPTYLPLHEPSRELEILELDAGAFEETVGRAGGRWEKRGGELVIVPPRNQESPDWRNFERGVQKFYWPKRDGVIVTSDNDLIADENRRLFVYPSNPHAIVNMRRAGFYLGCKQSVLIFSPSGSGRSTGYASEGQHYADSVAIYRERIEGRFEPQNVWLTAYCGTCPMMVHLKSRLSELPINLLLESGFVDLQQDFIDPQGYIVKKFAAAHWEALSTPIASQRVFETRYNLERMISDRRLAGKVVIMTVANDQRLKASVGDKMERIFRKTCDQVLHVKFRAEGADPHGASYFSYPGSRVELLEFIRG